MDKAVITLTGAKSWSVGRFRFRQKQPVVSTDKELIEYCRIRDIFEVKEVKASPPTKAPAPAAKAKAAESSVEKESSDSSSKKSKAKAPAKRLTRKTKSEDGE